MIQTVREKFACRVCEKISQSPAPYHPVPRGWAGPSLLALIVFEKYGQHQPLNRQAERYARKGVELRLSTLADQVTAVLRGGLLCAARATGSNEQITRMPLPDALGCCHTRAGSLRSFMMSN